MHDDIDNPLLPSRMEFLTFWGLLLGSFFGWSLLCFFSGYLAAG
jgi:hypothetical protein